MLASNYIPEGMNVTLQSENGVLGLVRSQGGTEGGGREKEEEEEENEKEEEENVKEEEIV